MSIITIHLVVRICIPLNLCSYSKHMLVATCYKHFLVLVKYAYKYLFCKLLKLKKLINKLHVNKLTKWASTIYLQSIHIPSHANYDANVRQIQHGSLIAIQK
jgi:hypothetical protein